LIVEEDEEVTGVSPSLLIVKLTYDRGAVRTGNGQIRTILKNSHS